MRDLRHGYLVLLLVFGIGLVLFLDVQIGSDGFSYYMYLRSLVLDRDLNFYNEAATYNFWGAAMTSPLARTSTGYVHNNFAVGSSIAWTPFFLVAHLWASISNLFGSGVPLDGYSFQYIFAVSLSTALYAFVGVLISYRLASTFFSSRDSLLASILVWFGSPLVAYSFKDPSFSHAISFAAVALFLYLFLKVWNCPTLLGYAFLGAAGGFMVLSRWQEAVFFAVPAVAFVRDAIDYVRHRNWRAASSLGIHHFVMVSVTALVFSIQVIVWRTIYGTYFTVPQGDNFIRWTDPQLLPLLFSPYHGLFTYTPLLLISVVGLAFFPRKGYVLLVGFLLALLAGLYVNSVVADWWAGYSFGMRRMVDSTPIFIIGLAAIFARVGPHRRVSMGLKLIAALMVAWNLLLLVQTYVRMLPPNDWSFEFYLDAARNIFKYLEAVANVGHPQALAGMIFLRDISFLPTFALGALSLDIDVLVAIGLLMVMFFGLYHLLRRERFSLPGRLLSSPLLILVMMAVVLLDAGLVIADARTKVVYALDLSKTDGLDGLKATKLATGALYEGMNSRVVIAAGMSKRIEITDSPLISSLQAVSYVTDTDPSERKSTAAVIELTDGAGRAERLAMMVGLDTAELVQNENESSSSHATPVVRLRRTVVPWIYPSALGRQLMSYYNTRLTLANPIRPKVVEIRNTLSRGYLVIMGVSLVPINKVDLPQTRVIDFSAHANGDYLSDPFQPNTYGVASLFPTLKPGTLSWQDVPLQIRLSYNILGVPSTLTTARSDGFQATIRAGSIRLEEVILALAGGSIRTEEKVPVAAITIGQADGTTTTRLLRANVDVWEYWADKRAAPIPDEKKVWQGAWNGGSELLTGFRIGVVNPSAPVEFIRIEDVNGPDPAGITVFAITGRLARD